MIDMNGRKHSYLIHMLRLLFELMRFCLISEKEFHLVLLILLELCELVLFRHHEDFFEDLFVLLLALGWERFSAELGLLLVRIAHCLCHSICLFCLLLK